MREFQERVPKRTGVATRPVTPLRDVNKFQKD